MYTKFSLILLLSSLFMQVNLCAQSFDEFLVKMSAASPAEKPSIVHTFLSAQPAIPIIEPGSKVHFLYYGKAASVAIAGDATDWKPSMNLKQVDGSDLWYVTATYSPDTRLEYKIVLNGKDWKLDSLNQLVVDGGMGRNSELVMPKYERPLYVNEKDVVPWGFYIDTVIYSKYLGEKRKIRIYTPPKYEKSNMRYPVAYFHDGFEFFDRTSARNIMDNMTFDKKIRPMLAVFVEPVHRDEEYSGKLQAKYTLFIVKELIPYIAAHYRTLNTPESTAQFGISNGGNISLWIAATHPEKVGKAAAFSSNVESNVSRKFSSSACSNQKIYLDLGKYDLPQLIPMVHGLKKILDKRKCPVSFHEYPEGHNWAFWEKHLPDALEYFFPAK